MSAPGWQQIRDERCRQIDVLGWSAGHDDTLRDCELVGWALERLLDVMNSDAANPAKELAQAGALIAAELDRRLRLQETAKVETA